MLDVKVLAFSTISSEQTLEIATYSISNNILAGIACTLTGLTALSLVALAWFYSVSLRSNTGEEQSVFEVSRMKKLRDGNVFYRIFEAWILRIASYKRRSLSVNKYEECNRDMQVAKFNLPWTAEELYAVNVILCFMVAIVGSIYSFMLTKSLFGCVIITTFIVCLFYFILSNHVRNIAARKRDAIKRRLPYALNLIALMMETGATFNEGLQTVVSENKDHPIGEQFGIVQRDMELGRTLNEALDSLRSRVSNQDVNDIVFAILQSNELGTPLSVMMRTQADQMLLRRSQQMEKESAEAQVAIVFPGMLIMIACLMIIVSPFILQAIYGSPSSGL